MNQIHLGIYPDTFPHTIQDLFWVQKGSPGKESWIGLGKLTNGLFFLYIATCRNTKKTFLDGGQMNLWVARQFSDLIHFAMDQTTYIQYISETKESTNPTNATSQMSHQASDAL